MMKLDLFISLKMGIYDSKFQVRIDFMCSSFLQKVWILYTL